MGKKFHSKLEAELPFEQVMTWNSVHDNGINNGKYPS